MAKGVSVHIGVNEVDPAHYGGWSGKLNACEADAEDLQAIANAQGFKTTLLATGAATRDAVIKAIKSAAAVVGEGDIFFLTYSGHGGQIPDTNGDERDLQDETWCLFDAQLVDDELRVLWCEFRPGVRILVLSDSCHSGSVTKAPVSMTEAETLTRGPLAEILGTVGAKYRFMPDDAAARTYRKNRTFYDDIQKVLPQPVPPVAATVRLISACQDNQLSLDGTFNGLFTGQLLRIWSSGRFEGDYSAFHKAILQRMPATQSPNHLVFGAANPAFDAETPFSI
jgi:metacaspase-1